MSNVFEAGRVWVPSSFECAGDVWDAAERLEHHFYSSVGAIALSRSHVLGDDFGLRLLYLRRLLSDLGGSQTERNPQQKRQLEQQILDDLSVPPDVRLVLWKARSLPVLLLMYTLERAGGHVYPVVEQALREGIDSMIAFALGMLAHTGKQSSAAPSGLVSGLPEPMDIQRANDRWRSFSSHDPLL